MLKKFITGAPNDVVIDLDPADRVAHEITMTPHQNFYEQPSIQIKAVVRDFPGKLSREAIKNFAEGSNIPDKQEQLFRIKIGEIARSHFPHFNDLCCTFQ